MKILVVEDDRAVAQSLTFLLSDYNYAVDVAEDGETGLQLADAYDYDLILLDVVLPGLDGIQVCEQLRAQGKHTPILLLTGLGSGHQKAIALNSGADDYVVKPYDAEELIARVQALLRRGGATDDPVLTWGQLSVAPSDRCVTYGTHLLTLTPKEYAILELFLRHPEKTLNAQSILDHVWTSVESPGEEAVRVHIKEIRQKLKMAGAPKDVIKTVHRVGYRLNPLYSSFLASQPEQHLTAQQIAELRSVNEELRIALEQLQLTQSELSRKNQELEAAYQTLALERLSLQQTRDELEQRVSDRTAELLNVNQFLQQQQDQWQALFDYALDAITITDDQGRYVDANPAACELLGVPKATLLQSSVTDFVRSQVDVTQRWQEFLQRGQQFGEFRLHRPDGTCRDTEYAAIANFIPGHHLAILRDVSERKRIEQERQQTEIALKQSEEKFRHFAENSNALIWIADVATAHNIYASPAYETIWGRSQRHLMADPDSWLEAIHPEDRPKIDAKLAQERQGIASNSEYRIIQPDGSVRWVWDRGFPIRNQAGDLYLYGGITEDITDRKQVELALRDREMFLSSIYDGADQAIFVIDVIAPHEFRYVAFNHKAEQYAGLMQHEVQGKTPEAAFGEEVGAIFRDNYQRCLETGTNLTYEEEVRLENHTIWTLTNLSPIRNEQGAIYRIVGTCIDISDRKSAEAQLRQSEQKLRAIFDSTFELMGVLTPEGMVVDINKTALDLVNCSLDQVLGQSFPATPWWNTLPEQQQRLTAAIAEAARGTFVRFETQHIWADGTLAFVDFSIKPVVDDAGQVILLIPEGRDITDRKRAEETLRKSEQKYHQILDSIADMVVVKQSDSHLVWANRAFREYYGMTQTELQGIIDAPFNQPNYTQQYVKDDALVFATGQPLAISEEPVTRHDGVVRTFSTVKAPIFDEAGQVIMLVAVCRDITEHQQLQQERQEAEVALQKSEAQLRLTLELNAIGSWDWRIATGEEIWSANHYRLLGYEPGACEASYQRWRDRVHPDDIDRVEQLHAQALANETDYEAEFRLVLPDGTLRWVLSRGRGLYNSVGQPVRMVGVLFDITDRKQAEIAMQQHYQRDQLIADITQDIRRSLNLNDVLSRTVERVRALLNTDRVLIFRFRPNWVGDVIMESVSAEWRSILSTTISDPCFRERYIIPYRQGRVSFISDLQQAPIQPCYVELLQQFQVKANLVVPILQGEDLWGLLIVHHCSAPRQWQQGEIELLQQLATQVGIAIQQSELYQQTRSELIKREQIQSILEESEERFRTLSTAAPVGICQTNADGICLYTNARWQEMSGLSFEDSLGNGWLEAVHPGDRELMMTAWEAYLAGGSECLPEFRLLTPQGDVRWVAAKVATMKSGNGEVLGYVGIDEDITERKLAEQKIREQAALLDVTSDAIFVRDLNHCILYWNQGATRLYGWTEPEAVGQVAYNLMQNEADHIAAIMQTLWDQGDWRGEMGKTTKTGRTVTVEARWTLVRNELNQPKFILTVETDITEKKQLEAQFYRAQRLESLGTLASGIAHDLNNVLTPILGIAQLLRLKQLNLEPRSQQMLAVLEDSAKRGANMVKQILTFTRGTEGDHSPIPVLPIVQEVCKVVQQTFPRTISIHEMLPQSSPLRLVSANSTHLHQVLMNLCVNARDAMPDGGTLTLAVEDCLVDSAFVQKHLDAKAGHYVVLTVADTGTGIPSDVRDRIFEPFFTTKAPGQGTGLGLATVLGIVKNYGGFVQVTTEVGQGTQFKVYLPALAAVSQEPPHPLKTFDGRGQKVLLVDDDMAVQQGTQALLENHHCTTLVTDDGNTAIALYIQHQAEIRVVLLDIMMPKMSGIELIYKLKAINSNVKIIAMSGLPTNREAALAAGANAFLQKPYTLETLIETLQTFVISNDGHLGDL